LPDLQTFCEILQCKMKNFHYVVRNYAQIFPARAFGASRITFAIMYRCAQKSPVPVSVREKFFLGDHKKCMCLIRGSELCSPIEHFSSNLQTICIKIFRSRLRRSKYRKSRNVERLPKRFRVGCERIPEDFENNYLTYGYFGETRHERLLVAALVCTRFIVVLERAARTSTRS